MPIIRNFRNHVDRLLRNAHATGAATATSGQGPMIFNEQWRAALDTTNTWTATLGVTGTAAVGTVSGVRVLRLLAPAISDTSLVEAKAILTNPFARVPTAASALYRSIVLEFEMQLVNVASITNTAFLAGLYSGASAGRSANDAIGFILASDALNTLTDKGSVETVNVVSPAPTLTNWNKYKIVCGPTTVRFYVNDVLVSTHSDSATLPDTAGIQAAMFYLVSDAAADPEVKIGPCRCYLEE